jgi:hypothetical protein
MICNDQTTMFGGLHTCTRDELHFGPHQTMPIADSRGREWVTEWSDGGGSKWQVVDERHPHWVIIACSSCGLRHRPDSNRLTKGGTACFHCVFWTGRMAQYANGELMVIDGTVYSWGAQHGFGGREFTITTADGVTTTKRGLWCGGTIPPEFRGAMPDNAVFGDRRSTDRVRSPFDPALWP